MFLETGRGFSPDELLERYYGVEDLSSRENANRYRGPSGFFSYVLDDHLSRFINIIPSKTLRAHMDGTIYIHKLPYSLYIPYCTGHSVSRLLRKGLKTITIVSRPAKHFDTLIDHLANYLITMQHYFTGAQAFSSVEWYAGPFIRNDKLSYRDVKQQVQRLLYNLNYPTRIGLQTCFTNFTIIMDTPRKMLESDKAVYGGQEVEPLGAYEDEAKTFLKALVELYCEGDSIGQPFTFPIPTLMATARWLWEDPEIREAVFKTAAKMGSFYWLNTRVVDPNSAFSMCCRLVLDKGEIYHVYSDAFKLSSRRDLEEAREQYWKKVERQRFGGLWAVPDITGSVNVVDVNLPRLALEAKRDESRFWELYGEALGMVREACSWFRNRYVSIMRNYPGFYSMIVEYMPEFPALHFNTIGLIGLPEAAAVLMGEPDLWVDGARRDWFRAAELMRRMVEFAAGVARRWMEEERIPWNVEEVPGESASAKLAVKDVEKYPEILNYLPDPENPVYSTSIAPYYSVMDLVDRVEIECMVQKSFTGGVMLHLFLEDKPDQEALAKLTEKLVDTDLVYWSYTPAITFCRDCGSSFTGLKHECPKCGSVHLEIWSRIVGYYRPLSNWNPYKRREFFRRYHYKL